MLRLSLSGVSRVTKPCYVPYKCPFCCNVPKGKVWLGHAGPPSLYIYDCNFKFYSSSHKELQLLEQIRRKRRKRSAKYIEIIRESSSNGKNICERRMIVSKFKAGEVLRKLGIEEASNSSVENLPPVEGPDTGDFNYRTFICDGIMTYENEDIMPESDLCSNNEITNFGALKRAGLQENKVNERVWRAKKAAIEMKEDTMKISQESYDMSSRSASLQANLKSYMDVCIHQNQVGKAHASLLFYRNQKNYHANSGIIDKIQLYNLLLHGWAKQGNMDRVREILSVLDEDCIAPSFQTFAAALECAARASQMDQTEVKDILGKIKLQGFSLENIFVDCTLSTEQIDYVSKAVRLVLPNIEFAPPKFQKEYSCRLLHGIKDQEQGVVNHLPMDLCSATELKMAAREQLANEWHSLVTVKSIEANPYPVPLAEANANRVKLKEVEHKFRADIATAFDRNVEVLANQSASFKFGRKMHLLPFLTVLPAECFVDLLMSEIRRLAQSSETFSIQFSHLCKALGYELLDRYKLHRKKHDGVMDKIYELYGDRFMEYYCDPVLSSAFSPREYWQHLISQSAVTFSLVEMEERHWPVAILFDAGRFLYDILLKDIAFDTKMLDKNDKLVRPFYSVYRQEGKELRAEIKVHPLLCKMYRNAGRNELTFETRMMPMMAPPMPWVSKSIGGYPLATAVLIRLPPEVAPHVRSALAATPRDDLNPSLDSLNQLGECPWVVNQRMLDLVISIFNSGGNLQLDIPIPSDSLPPAPKITKGMSKAERSVVMIKRLQRKRKKDEMYSQWCDTLYKLSIANHLRDRVFWLPHNMDFRGRTYPVPPHFNHLGSDLSRSLMLFAHGKPLGQNGLDWLKLHLVNLTGFKKKESLADRLVYADEVLSEIMDSADRPLDGRGWWKLSGEPWQTLSCCIELTAALRSPDYTKYVCHLPVHQDGSCNGLQHYAALGRDIHGAEQVNLTPSTVPQDVYEGVAKLVEEIRERDALAGIKVAHTLEGFVQRKVIKQTVMTTVYGVTRFGARLQIMKQLKAMDDFPPEHHWAAAGYLVSRTFQALQTMFTATKLIQDWLTDSARLVSTVCGQPVEWVTPLGLPVIQPYHKLKRTEPLDMIGNPLHAYTESFARPNTMKQKNAFPPNFIHSLDSTHMMLTSIHCRKAGITFVSVHDCYWTHPSSVETMNQICRQQFVALHKEPILEELSKSLLAKFGYDENCVSGGDPALSKAQELKAELNKTLANVPERGKFDVKKVLDSTYFFS